MSGFTTHVIDAVRGGGAVGVGVVLRVRHDGDSAFRLVSRAETDVHGRARLLEPEELIPGLYELAFATAPFHRADGHEPFFDEVVVNVAVMEHGGSLHVPIVLSPAAYSVYRGGKPPVGAAALPPELDA